MYEHIPLQVRIDLSAAVATPAIASMIGRILIAAGAKVTANDKRVQLDAPIQNLQGLEVHIDRITWVTETEAERWN